MYIQTSFKSDSISRTAIFIADSYQECRHEIRRQAYIRERGYAYEIGNTEVDGVPAKYIAMRYFL